MRCRNISKSGHFVLLIVLCFDATEWNKADDTENLPSFVVTKHSMKW